MHPKSTSYRGWVREDLHCGEAEGRAGWSGGQVGVSGLPKSPVFFISFTCPMPQLVEGNFALFCTYTLDFRNEFQNLLLAIMVSTGRKVSR